MRKVKMMVIGILVAGMVIGSCGASWGAPMKINVQGRLEYTTSTTPGTITFRIYEGGDESGGGRDAWTDKRGIIKTGTPGPDQVLLDPDTKIFNVVLGPKDDTDRDMPEFLTDNYYLEILVESETLTPRQQLVSVPYAITARNVEGDGTVRLIKGSGAAILARVSGGEGPAIIGQYGESTSIMVVPPLPTAIGILGHPDEFGVWGWAEAGTNTAGVMGLYGADRRTVYSPAGVFGEGGSTGYGVYGVALNGTTAGVAGRNRLGDGVRGWSEATDKAGVFGENANGYGVYGKSTSQSGVYGETSAFIPFTIIGPFTPPPICKGGVVGKSTATSRGYPGVKGESVSGWGVYGSGEVGVVGFGRAAGGSFECRTVDGYGVYSYMGPDWGNAVYGHSADGTAIIGIGQQFPEGWDLGDIRRGGDGVRGFSRDHYGIYGVSTNDIAVNAYSQNSTGVSAGGGNTGVRASGGNYGIYASSGSGHGVFGVAGGAPTMTPSNKYGGLFTSVGSGKRALGVYGTGFATGGFVTSGLDIAEWVKVSGPMVEAGDVVALDAAANKSVVKASGAYNKMVAGIVSTDPAFLAGSSVGKDISGREEMEAKGYRMLALAGQVPCKVSTENGPIAVGDLLTTSNTPGYAMKATDPKIGTILGKAMEPLASGNGKIMVLVTLQ